MAAPSYGGHESFQGVDAQFLGVGVVNASIGCVLCSS